MTLIFGLLLGLLAVTAVAAGVFNDDDGNVHEANIEAIAADGITRGCNPPINDLYCPTDPVTRGQMAAFLVRAMGYTDDGGGDKFVDDDSSVFEADIDRLAEAGVTLGCNPPANTEFCPDGFVTRGQMAAFLVRAMGYTDDGGGDKFVDDDGSVFEADIDRLAEAGVTLGCNPPVNDRFCPSDPVLRDQMASFLARALDLESITPSTTTTTTTTTTDTTIPADYPRSGDSWEFEDCETNTGTCTYSVSAHLLIGKPLLPTAYVFNPVSLKTEEVAMWRIRWFDPSGVEIPGPWYEQTLYDSGTAGIAALRVSMPLDDRAPGDHRVEMCRRESQYTSTCAVTLLTVYFRVDP
ncbi:MAG TPA: hypothetical protein VLB85_04185 [Acidimicrobiia bacterium]|nr:hypothetical protein [Acidimicrobiia bacterium]